MRQPTLLLIAAMALSGCTPPSQVQPGTMQGMGLHWREGDREVSVDLACDRLAAQVAAGTTLPQPFRAEPEAGTIGFPAVQDGDQVAARAAALTRVPGVSAVQAVLADGGILTHQVSLRLHPDGDAVAVAADHGAQVVGAVPGLPDAWILEPIDQHVLAAVPLAQALARDQRVVASAPLVLRQRTPKER